MPSTDDTAPPATPAIDKEALRERYAAERDKRLRPDGNDQYLRLQGQLGHYLDDPVRPARRARTAGRPRHGRPHRRGLRRPRDRGPPRGGRRRRRPHRREGRRLRRHLVLEPLPGCPVRHRVLRVHAVARRDRAHAHREVRPRPGDPRALPAHREAVRAVRRRTVPHRGHRSDLGRDPCPMDRPHRPGRRLHRAVRHDGHRSAPRPQAAGHPRHRLVRGPLVPHQPVGLRLHRRRPGGGADGPPGRQAGGGHRHRRHRGAVRPPPGPGLPRALRVPAHPVVGGRPRQPADRPRVVRRHGHARLAAALARELHGQPDGRDGRRGPGDGRVDRHRPPRPQPDHGPARRPVHPRGHAGRLRGLRLREDGGDPGARRRHRRGPRHRPGPEGLVRPALQATLLPRRVPAGLQPPEHAPRGHRRQGRRADHRDGRRRRRRALRGRLHHLRLGLRGGHRVHASAPAST